MNKIFSNYGCDIFIDNDKYFIECDSGESVGSRLLRYEITKASAEKAMRSENDAYQVILEAQSGD